MKRNILLSIAAVAALSLSTLSFSMQDTQKPDIFEAIENDNTERVKELVKDSNFDVNKIIEFGEGKDWTPLSRACLRRNLENVKLLIENGADINKENGKTIGVNPLIIACINGFTEIAIELLTHKDIDVNKAIGGRRNNAFINACFKGHTDIVKLLLENGATVIGFCCYLEFSDDSFVVPESRPGISKLFNLAAGLDISVNRLGFIDSQTDDEIVDFLCKRLYSKYGIRYDGRKKSLMIFKNKKGLRKFSDCKIIIQEQE